MFKRRHSSAFTLIEVLFVIGTLMLVALVSPALFRPKPHRCCGISCSSNLKQIGLAFRMWANDHEERFPMQVSVLEDGTKEIPLTDLAVATFSSISNELNNPKPLVCPDDPDRKRTNDFAQLSIKNISYFIGLDASEYPFSILAGDRNLSVGSRLMNGLIEITNPVSATWDWRMHMNQGNIVLADGSAHGLDNRLLWSTLTNTCLATNRFLIP